MHRTEEDDEIDLLKRTQKQSSGPAGLWMPKPWSRLHARPLLAIQFGRHVRSRRVTEAADEVPSGARRARRRCGVDRQEPAQPTFGAGTGRGDAAGERGAADRLRLRLRGVEPGRYRGAE